MAYLHLSLSNYTYESKKINSFANSHYTHLIKCDNASGSCLFYDIFSSRTLKASCFLVGNENFDGGVEVVKRGMISGSNSIDCCYGVVGRRRRMWKRRVDSLRRNEVVEKRVESEHGCDVCDEFDVGVYGVGSRSSLESCNRVLKSLESGDDGKAMEFFEWMRSKRKLKGNVEAYNLILRVLGRRYDWVGAEKLIEEMKFESQCELGFRVFNTIIYACSKKGFVDIGTKWFRMMLEYDVEPNVATFGMLMSLYQKSWNVEEAEYVFHEMRRFNVRCQSAYSSMITIYTRLGLHSKAEEVIDLLSKDEVVLNSENWLVMLNAYSQQGKMEDAERVLLSMHERHFPPNIVAYNTLITGYGKASNMKAAERTFQTLKRVGLNPDETTYRSMIEGWARSANYEKTRWYYEELKSLGFKPNSSNLYSLINLQAKHEDEDGAIRTIGDMMKMSCHLSSILSSLIQAYEKAGRFDKVPLIVRGSVYEHVLSNQTACSSLAMAYVKYSLVDDAIKLLEHKRWKDPVFQDNLYHLLICSCKELGYLENAVKIFTHMPKPEANPNLHIFSTTIDIFSMLNRFSDADEIYKKLNSSGVTMDLVSYSIVVRMYVKAGLLDDACGVLDTMEKQTELVPDIYLLRDMLRIYQKCNRRDKLEVLYYKILKREVIWDQEMYNCVINCCAHALPVDEISRLFDEMIQRGFTPNTITYNVMLDVYGKSRIFKKAQKVLWMARKQGLADAISYNTLIAAYGKSKCFKKMKRTMRLMKFNGFAVSLEAYNSMLNAYGKRRQMEKFGDILQRLKESNCTSDHYTYNTLINIYGEQGWIEEVTAVLTELKEHGPGLDLCSYNTLIKAYGIAGKVEEAVSMVKQMRESGINPDKITYLNLISALRRNDKFLEAVRWSLWMKQTGMS